MTKLREIRERLAQHEPELASKEGKQEASVALVLRDVGPCPEVLFIERAQREGDPWSGHMAFPGGRVDPTDAGTIEAAVRETAEEVGVSLVDAEHWGLLGEMVGGPNPQTGRLVVSAHVFRVAEPGPFVLNHEVREAFWFPLEDLRDDSRHVDHRHARTGSALFPGILVGEPERHVVWGLTYRFLELFFEVAARPLPKRWSKSELGRWSRGS